MKLKWKVMKTKLMTLLAFILLEVAPTMAQDSLNSQSVEILTPYKPIIDDAEKNNNNPLAPSEKDNVSKEFDYELPDIIFYNKYKPTPIKAIAYPKEKKQQLENNYTRLGIGYPLNSYLDIFINSKRQKLYENGFNLSIDHWNGDLNDYQKETNTSISLYSIRYFEKNTLKMNMAMGAKSINYYGLDPSITLPDAYNHESFKQRLNEIKIGMSFYNHKSNNLGIEYDFIGNISLFQAKERLEQTRFYTNALFEKEMFANDILSVNIENTYNYSVLDTLISNHNNLNLKSIYFYNREKLQLKLGINVMTESDETIYMIPEVYSETKLFENHIIYFTGWSGNLSLNNMSEILSYNPFASIDSILHATKHNKKFTGIKGKLDEYLSYTIYASLDNIQNAIFYRTDSVDTRKFRPSSSNVDLVNINAEIAYKITDRLDVIFKGDYYNYDISEAWHMPEFKIGFVSRYNIKDKIKIDGIIDYWGNSKNKNASGKIEEVNGFFDANLHLEYKYRDQIYFKIMLNNLLGKTYNRWANYPLLGFNAMVGVQFSF